LPKKDAMPGAIVWAASLQVLDRHVDFAVWARAIDAKQVIGSIVRGGQIIGVSVVTVPTQHNHCGENGAFKRGDGPTDWGAAERAKNSATSTNCRTRQRQG
jgi:hypothetical protein